MPVVSLTCYLKMMLNSQISGIPTVKLSMLIIVTVNVLLELCRKERLIVNLLLLGYVIPVVGFYGIPVMPTILALSHLLVV